MRTRTKTTRPVIGTDPRPYQILNQDGSVYLDGTFNNVSSGYDSVIIDEKPQFTRVGECSHVKTSYDGLESLDGTWIVLGSNKLSTPTPTPWFVSVRAHPRYLQSPAGTQSAPPAHVLPDPLSLAGLGARASNKLNQLTLANTLWETKDFPGMLDIKTRRERIGAALTGHRLSDSPTWRRLLKLSDRVRPLKGAKRLIEFSRLLRDENLGWALGWAPTIADAQKIRKELPRAWNQRKAQLKPFTVYTSDYVESSSSGTPFPNPDYSFEETSSTKRIGGLRCTPPKPKDYYYDQFRQADKLIQQGLGNPLSMLWEAVPWSFVVDWFLSIDDLIADSYLRGLSGYSLSAWTSSKQRTDITWSCLAFFNINTETGEKTEQRQVKWTHTRTTYSRTPANLPSLLTNVRFRLGPKQTFLGILLALGLIDGKKSHR